MASTFPEVAGLTEVSAIRQGLKAIPKAEVQLRATNRHLLNRLRKDIDKQLWMFDEDQAASIMYMGR